MGWKSSQNGYEIEISCKFIRNKWLSGNGQTKNFKNSTESVN